MNKVSELRKHIGKQIYFTGELAYKKSGWNKKAGEWKKKLVCLENITSIQ